MTAVLIGVVAMTVDAAPASATLLCSAPTCSLEGYPANTALKASLQEGTQAQLLSSLGTVECEKSSIAGETTAEAGKPLPLKVSSVAFEGNCHLGGTSCTVTTTTLPTSPSLEGTGEGNGTLSLEGGEVQFKCGSFINCAYSMKPLQFNGGKPAALSAEKLQMKPGKGFLCPEKPELDATYTLSEPATAYLVNSEGQTLLCSAPTCSLEGYPANTALKASLQEGTQAQLLSSLGTVECEKSSIAGETTAEAGKPLPLKVSSVAFEGNCHLSGTSCTVITTALPTSPSLEGTEEGNGTLSLEGGEVQFKCGSFINCTYSMKPLQFNGGKPAALSAEKLQMKPGKGFLCPEKPELDATYTLTEPAPAYLVI